MKRMICYFLSVFIFSSSVAMANPSRLKGRSCEGVLFSQKGEDALQGLVSGEKIYGETPFDFEVDEQTQVDMDLEHVAELLDPYLRTDMGKARWRYRLAHPLLRPEDIRRTQEVVRYIADHPEIFAELRAHLSKLKKENEDFLQVFTELQKDTDSKKADMLFAGLTVVLMILPKLLKPIYYIGAYLHMVLAGQGSGLGYANAINKVMPKRALLLRFRNQMVTAKLTHEATSESQNQLLTEIRSRIGVIYSGINQSFVNKKWLGLNAALNDQDKDLLPQNREEEDLTSEEALGRLNQNLRMLERNWLVRIPGTQKSVPISNLKTLSDKTFYSNFWLPKVRAAIVDSKPKLAKVFSALAEMDVLLAMAEFYQEHRERLIFPEILDEDQPTQLMAEDAHHYSIAVEKPADSVGNDLKLGETPEIGGHAFVISFSETGGGATTYQQMAGTNQILAQNGMPWFAKSGRLTPGVLMTSLDLTTSLTNRRGYTDIEAERIGTILRLSDAYPHSFTYINNPFTEGGEFAGIALREATIHALMESQTLGIMSTRSRVLLREIRREPRLNFIHIQNFRAKPFDLNNGSAQLRPDAYYAALIRKGFPKDVIEEAKVLYDRLQREHIETDENE